MSITSIIACLSILFSLSMAASEEIKLSEEIKRMEKGSFKDLRDNRRGSMGLSVFGDKFPSRSPSPELGLQSMSSEMSSAPELSTTLIPGGSLVSYHLSRGQRKTMNNFKAALDTKDYDAMESLFASGVHPDSIRLGDKRTTPLMDAYEDGDLELANFLRLHGAQPGLQTPFGQNAMVSAIKGRVSLDDLEKSGMSIRSHGTVASSPLVAAAQAGRYDVTDWLLNTKGIDINASLTTRTHDGTTRTVSQGVEALSSAIDNGVLWVVKPLLAARVSVTAPDSKGLSAVQRITNPSQRTKLAALGVLPEMDAELEMYGVLPEAKPKK